jgi:hypothetical protein
MLEKLKGKGAELLITLTAAGMLLSVALGIVGDALLMGIIGFWGWFIATPDDAQKK